MTLPLSQEQTSVWCLVWNLLQLPSQAIVTYNLLVFFPKELSILSYENYEWKCNWNIFLHLNRLVVSPPLLRSVNGQSILTQQKSWSLLPPRPRNAIPESIASHSSLFPSISFSLSLSLSLWPISGDSSSCRRRPKTEEEAVAEEIPNTKHTCWPPDIF